MRILSVIFPYKYIARNILFLLPLLFMAANPLWWEHPLP